MLKVLITGCTGYIATSLIAHFKDRYDITSIGRKDFNLADRIATNNWFKSKKFDVVIHTASTLGGRLVANDNDILSTNLSMFLNLKANKDKFKKIISFGSGAERDNPSDYYGMSKSIINQFIINEENFYNLRIFGLFDENENDTRFIKSNINRYLHREPICINQNKLMDFFYMKDLYSLIIHYIESKNLSKEIDCVYREKYALLDIANIINQQDTHKVPIQILKDSLDIPYLGKSNLPIATVGLLGGIKTTFLQLQSRHNQL